VTPCNIPNWRWGRLAAKRWVNRWHAMMKSKSKRMKVVRALRVRLNGAANGNDRSSAMAFSGGARKAMEKSAEQDGDDGVTTIAGSGDFSPICERGTSPAAGIRM